MRIARAVLIVLGVGLLIVGGIVLLQDVKPIRYVGILWWFAGAIILHDGILSFVIVGISLFSRRLVRVPLVPILILQGALAIAALFALLVVPEILKKGIGSANPTILPLDYGPNLLMFYAALTLVTAVAITVYLAVARRRSARSGARRTG